MGHCSVFNYSCFDVKGSPEQFDWRYPTTKNARSFGLFKKLAPVVIYYASFLEKNILLVISVDYIFSKVLK